MINKENFLIDYTIYGKDKSIIKNGKIRVKNKQGEFEAKCSLEKYLKKKYSDFSTLVIHKCDVDILGSSFDNINPNIMSTFNRIFGGKL